MNQSSDSFSDGLPTPQRYWAAAAVAMGISMSVLDANIVNVALPVLAKELGVSESSSVWVVNAYNLSVLAFILPCAALGERLGLERVFRFGLMVFILGSLGFMFSNTLSELCLFKVFQGVGGAAMMSMMGGLTRFNYPAQLFARGIGINAMVVSMSSMAGPMIGSAILHYASWHWLSFLSIPVGLTALLLSRFLASTPQKKNKFDYVSAVLCAFTLCLLVYSIDRLVDYTRFAVVGGVVAVACGWVMIRRARKQDAPLVPVDLLRIDTFRFAIYVSSFSFAASMVALVCLPFHLQSVFGLTQLEVGYFLVVWPLGSGTMALVAARLVERYSASILAGIGASAMAVAMLGLAVVPADVHRGVLLFFIALVGVGFGFFQTPNNKVMLSAPPRERSGAAGGVQATTRVFSQSIGAAIVALALALPVAQPTKIALWGGFICALMAAVVNMVRYKTLS
ncbi:MAG: MFS transporter [Saezia sp.]